MLGTTFSQAATSLLPPHDLPPPHPIYIRTCSHLILVDHHQLLGREVFQPHFQLVRVQPTPHEGKL